MPRTVGASSQGRSAQTSRTAPVASPLSSLPWIAGICRCTITGTSQPPSRTLQPAESLTFFCTMYCESLSLHDHQDVKTTVKIYKRGTPRTAGSCRCKIATTSNHRRDLHCWYLDCPGNERVDKLQAPTLHCPSRSSPPPPPHDSARESNTQNGMPEVLQNGPPPIATRAADARTPRGSSRGRATSAPPACRDRDPEHSQ